MLVGGNGRTVLDRVLAFGDAWMPTHRGGGVVERVDRLRARAQEAGREIPVSVVGVPADARVLERYATAGVSRALFWLPSATRGPLEQALERIEGALAELRGE